MNYNLINLPNARRSKKCVLLSVLLVGFVILNSYALWCKFKAVSDNSPHIVIIIADDLGWNDVSFHGSNQIPTPNIDALAYNGVILNRHYVLPTCSASRSSLMTGRYPIRDGMQGPELLNGQAFGIPLNVTLMPEYLRRLGYETHLVGKWHLGYYTENHTPTKRGFDTFFGYYNGYITYLTKLTSTFTKHNQITGYDLHRDSYGHLSVASDHDTYFTDLVTNEAVGIIKNNNNKKPLFLEISHLAAHSSGLPETMEIHDWYKENRHLNYIKDHRRRQYAGVVKALDDSVGKVVKALKDAEMLDNSIILFMSDNGAPTKFFLPNSGSNYPLRGIKNTMFDGGIRGAACIFSPLIKKSSRLSEDYIHMTDWLPTLYSAANGKVSDLGEIDGHDQWESLVKGVISPRHNVLINIDEKKNIEAAIVGRYKLIKGVDNKTESYYGDSGYDPLYPEYKVEDALISSAGWSIGSLSEFNSVTAYQARNLRKSAVVKCKRPASIKSCSDVCLFDIISDPCETQDLSENYSIINVFMRQLIQVLIEKYRAVLSPQPIYISDKCSYPKYFNGTWMPWRKNDGTLINMNLQSVCQ